MNKIEWIIALLYAKNNGKIYGITRMEKLLFFYLKLKENIGDLNNFKYEAYDYGPHSDDIRDILYTLRDKGVINIETKNTYDFFDVCAEIDPYISIGSDAHRAEDIGGGIKLMNLFKSKKLTKKD